MKKIITLILSLILLLSFTACGPKKGNDSSSNSSSSSVEEKPEVKDVEVWNTYSTAKVMMDRSLNGNYENLGNTLRVNLAKGEAEMSQMVISVNDSATYDVEISDLKCGNNIFKKENIEVFHQRPIKISTKTSDNYNEKFPIGLTPDCLLPFEIAKNYNENKINANSNQPVSFEFKTKTDTPAGTYTGTFKITVNGKIFKVPVEMKVWNYVAPQNMYGRTCMLIYQNELFEGEMDASDEMYTRYYETLLEHKMNAWHVPYTTTKYVGDGKTTEEEMDKLVAKMVESVKKYWDNPNFNGFGMPDLTTPPKGGDITVDPGDVNYSQQKKYLVALGKNSTPERILFDKAYFYHTVVDEPYAFPSKHKKVPTIIENVNNMFKEVMNELAVTGMFEGKPEFKVAVENSLMNMPQIITSPYSKDYDGSKVTYCPPIQYPHINSERENLKAHSEKENTETWTYTCNNPTYPFPTTHIDDYLIGSRIMRWMQKCYGMKGYLAWSVNQYSKIIPFDPTHKREKINPYEDPQRVVPTGPVANGDGYLFYPGKKYGSKTPFTSIRMKSLRDGQDDYDALCMLNEKYAEFDRFYNANGAINADKILSETYSHLFSGTIYNSSDAVFDSARNLVAEMIENSNLDEKLVLNSEVKGKNITFDVYANSGYSVKINGKNVTGTKQGGGMKYTTSIALDKFDGTVKVSVSKGSYKKDYLIKKDVTTLATDFSTSNGVKDFAMIDSNTVSVENGKANITINHVENGENDYQTGFMFKQSAFNTTFNNIESISFDVTNNNNEKVNFKVYAVIDGQFEEVYSVNLSAKESKNVFLPRVYAIKNSGMNKSEGLFFGFNNKNLLNPCNISIGNFYFVTR